MGIDAVYFDFAGVLVSDGFADLGRYEERFGAAKNALQMAKNKHWLDLRIGKITEKEFWEKTFTDAGIEPADNFIEMVRSGMLESHLPYKHIFELAEIYRLSGLKVGMMTNTCEEWLRYWDGEFSLSGIFSPIITSYELGSAKPDARYFYSAIKEYEIDPSKSLFFDDQQANVEAAKSAGFQAALLKPY